jgi:hypothetical protein
MKCCIARGHPADYAHLHLGLERGRANSRKDEILV